MTPSLLRDDLPIMILYEVLAPTIRYRTLIIRYWWVTFAKLGIEVDITSSVYSLS